MRSVDYPAHAFLIFHNNIMVHNFGKRGEVIVTAENSGESDDEHLSSPSISEDEITAEAEDDDTPETPATGNACWADAIANVLGTKKPKNKRTIILAKAKKDTDFKKKNEEKMFDIVDEEGKVQDVEVVSKVKKRKKVSVEDDDDDSSSDEYKSPLELQKSRNKKLLWESMSRIKPSPLSKDRERHLTQIATKGVVQLFNAVRQHQKKLDINLKSAGNSEVKQEKVMKSVSKGAFLDLLKGCPSQKISGSSKDEENGNTNLAKDEKDQSWSVLKEDFLLGASLKDWDKVEVAQS